MDKVRIISMLLYSMNENTKTKWEQFQCSLLIKLMKKTWKYMDKVRTISMLIYSNKWKYKDKVRIISMLL
jgi:hypothetical protein